MQMTAKWRPEAERYSTMSGLSLLFVIVAPVCTWFAVRSDLAAIRAIGVLLIPFAPFGWVFTTIRALHRRDIQFWTIPPTYVAFFGGFLATFCLLVSTFFLPDGRQLVSESFTFSVAQSAKRPADYTMVIAVMIVEAGTVLWCLWYNWRKTNAAILAISVTALQILLSSSVVVFFWLRFGWWRRPGAYRPVAVSPMSDNKCRCRTDKANHRTELTARLDGI
jgi:hypothetical protein